MSGDESEEVTEEMAEEVTETADPELSETLEELSESLADTTERVGSEVAAALRGLGDDAGEARAAIANVVGTYVDRTEGFAPGVLESLADYEVAGIDTIERTEDGLRVVAEDGHGVQAVRTLLDLDPREYDVSTRTEGEAEVVEVAAIGTDAGATAVEE